MMRQQPQHRDNDIRLHAQKWVAGMGRTLTGAGIEYALSRSPIRGPQVFTIRLGLGNAGQLSKLLGLEEQLALNMGVDHVRVHRSQGYVDVEVGLPQSLCRALSVRHLAKRNGPWVGLGQSPSGQPVYLNTGGTRTSHCLIAGTTGSGKTVTEQLFAWWLAQGNEPDSLAMILIDGKGGVRWRGFENVAHLAHPVISKDRDAVSALFWAVAEMTRRYEIDQNTPAIYIIIDELARLVQAEDKRFAVQVQDAVQRLVQMGREAGIHLIAATQYPDVAGVGGGSIKANFPVRLVGMVTDSQAAYLATGVRGTGAERLGGNGDFLAIVAGQAQRVQIALVTERNVAQLKRRETVPLLPLEEFAEYDPDRILEQAPETPTPRDVATALTLPNMTVRAVRDALKPCATDRAGLVRRFAQTLAECLREKGFSIYPIIDGRKEQPPTLALTEGTS